MLLAGVDWYAYFFLLFASIACLFAVAVLFTNNIVRMAFYLTMSLGATAGIFFLAGAEFVGAMQLMIYVGGTLVLLIFGVMLTAQARFITMRTSSGEWILAILVGSALLLLLLAAAFGVEDWCTRSQADSMTVADAQTATAMGAALSGVRVDRLNVPSERPERQRGMSGYLLPFVIISVHLLVVLVGAAYMARARLMSHGAAGSAPRAVPPRRSQSAAPS